MSRHQLDMQSWLANPNPTQHRGGKCGNPSHPEARNCHVMKSPSFFVDQTLHMVILSDFPYNTVDGSEIRRSTN